MTKTEELSVRRKQIELGGGTDKLNAQRGAGKLTARERLDLLFDKNSFVEIGAFRTHHCTDFGMTFKAAPGDGVITGYGQVDGRLVYAYAQDFTVLGGSLGAVHAEKICRIQETALKNGAPVVGLMDSGGARIQEGVCALAGYGKIFCRNTLASGVIPQISAIMGPCAGGAVYSPAITDYIVMVDKTSNMFITGPEVIRTVTGESVTGQDLGGAAVHSQKSGVAHFISHSDEQCIHTIRRLLGYMPDNNGGQTPLKDLGDDPGRPTPQLETLVPDDPRKAYNMLDVIHTLVDRGEFMEVQKDFAANIIVGYGRFNGRTVGIVANQPRIAAGCLDVDASDKAARFIRCCDSFNTPLLTLADVPGFLPGVAQEHRGIIRHGAKLLYAYSEATVPKITVITRKAYGGAYIGMCCSSLGADAVFAWPGSEIAVMGAEAAAGIVFRHEIRASASPEAVREEKIKEYEAKFSGPYFAAEHGFVDDIIPPWDTRRRIISALESAAGKEERRPGKKHGNIPL